MRRFTSKVPRTNENPGRITNAAASGCDSATDCTSGTQLTKKRASESLAHRSAAVCGKSLVPSKCSIMLIHQICAVNACPVGTTENSPALQCWEGRLRNYQSPVGTTELQPQTYRGSYSIPCFSRILRNSSSK